MRGVSSLFLIIIIMIAAASIGMVYMQVQQKQNLESQTTTTLTSTSLPQEINTKEASFYPIDISIPRIYDMRASDNPQDYLGSRIASEKPSDWENYQPMVVIVNNLVKNQNNDYDRVVAISNWIKSSKNYSETDYPHDATVIETFNYKTGVCYDSALLTAAMIRLAGIPARSVAGQFGTHQWNEVYLRDEGVWTTVDNTYGSANYTRGMFLNILINNGTSFVSISQYWTTKYNISDPQTGDVYKSVDFYKSKISSKDDYGTVLIPITHNLTVSHGTIKIQGGLCKENASVEGFSVPGLYFIGRNREIDGGSWSDSIPITGYLKFNLPACNYRIYYGFRFPQFPSSDYQIAYADFEITNRNDFVVLTAKDFRMVEGSDSVAFGNLVGELQKIPPYSTLEIFS